MPDCRNCPRRFNCVGVKFDHHRKHYVCPHELIYVDFITIDTETSDEIKPSSRPVRREI